MKKLSILLTFAFTLVLSSGNTTNNSMNQTSQRNGNTLKFKNYSCIDIQGTGTEAYSFLMPADWQFEGGITWNPEQVAMPATNSFRVYNPSGQEEFEGFPNQCFFWSTNSGLLTLHPPGSKYFGSVVAPPVDALTALRKIIHVNRNHFQDLKIISANELPELVEALGIGDQDQEAGLTEGNGAKIRFSYVKNGIPLEEEIYGVVEQVRLPVQTMAGMHYNTWWYVDYVFSFKAKAGELDRNTEIFQTMASSFRINPLWQAKYSNVVEFLAQQQVYHIWSIGEFSRLLSRMSDRMRSDQLRQYERRSRVYDRIARQYNHR